jgi:hypothetical protein
MQQALWMVGSFGVTRDFGTQNPIGMAVIRVALDFDRDPVFDRRHQ